MSPRLPGCRVAFRRQASRKDHRQIGRNVLIGARSCAAGYAIRLPFFLLSDT